MQAVRYGVSEYPKEGEKKKMYKEPDTPYAALLWRLYMWITTTFALSVMEPWEKLLVITTIGFIFALIGIGIVRYMPQFVVDSTQRTQYYLLG
ncbi:uncharacterized protein FOMMEDRAFT_137984 [Fomitiporia mediterranea MF3/22]|uniref:uncharacterized protein n=1 Tax=Fomitiporia mediterranea (strain MF3/22) TaxID=694068 RepID=UPI0004407B1A|nr:uncharacterized protein FOMMEDRAFT_137984 [Fomitiporia mediterranea MF3/22]EJD07823.1 hypothetical protein FOMMEDRAFT_137984 [Fomitiporia mediterranea MF3/22]